MRALQGCLHALSHGHLGAILELLRERMGTIRKDKDERLFVPFQHAVGGLAFGVEDEGTQPRVRVCWSLAGTLSGWGCVPSLTACPYFSAFAWWI